MPIFDAFFSIVLYSVHVEWSMENRNYEQKYGTGESSSEINFGTLAIIKTFMYESITIRIVRTHNKKNKKMDKHWLNWQRQVSFVCANWENSNAVAEYTQFCKEIALISVIKK